MVAGVGGSIVKFFIIFFSVLVFVAGACILGVSIAAYVSNPVQEYMSEYFIGKIANYNSLRAVLIIGMILGCIGVIFGILGCIGAALEIKIVLIVYAILLALLLIAQIIIGALVLAYQDQVHYGIDDALAKMQTSAANVLDPHHKDACQAYHDLAKHHVCCGLEGHSYATCQDPYITCGAEVGGRPCSSEVWRWVKVLAIVSGIILIVFIILEVFAIICAFLLLSAIRQREKIDGESSFEKNEGESSQSRPKQDNKPLPKVKMAKNKVAPAPLTFSESAKTAETAPLPEPIAPGSYPKQQATEEIDEIEIVVRNRD